jgi:uncharacterized protein
MMRVAKSPEGVQVDRRQRLPGRGAYVHRDADCIERAVRRGGLARTLRVAPPTALLEALREGLE